MTRLNAVIKREFLGVINGIEINDKRVFYTAEYFLESMEDMNIAFDVGVVSQLIDDIDSVRYKDDFNGSDFESDCFYSLEENGRFPSTDGYGNLFTKLNAMLDELNFLTVEEICIDYDTTVDEIILFALVDTNGMSLTNLLVSQYGMNMTEDEGDVMLDAVEVRIKKLLGM